MLVTLKVIVEKFDPAKAEFNGWVLAFRDPSKKRHDVLINPVKSSITNVVDSIKRDRRRRLNAGNRAEGGRKMDWKVRRGWQNANASDKWFPPSKTTNLQRQVKSWKWCNMRLKKAWVYPQEEPKLESVITEVEEASGQESKRVKEEDKKIQDDDAL